MAATSSHFLGLLLLIGQAVQNEATTSCECKVQLIYSYYLQYETEGILCTNINTPRRVRCAKKYIASNVRTISKLQFVNSDTDLFPEDFIPPCKVLEIRLSGCKMTGIPYDFLESICPSLLQVWIDQCQITSKTISARGFGNCTGLRVIGIDHSGITTVSREAFDRLVNLQELHIYGNKLESFGGFEGVDNLKLLSLHSNKLKFLDKNAFRALSNLTEVNLSNNRLSTIDEGTFEPFLNNKDLKIFLAENPFHCNCSLQWLQDWLQKSKNNQFTDFSEMQPECVGPMTGTLRNLNFCNNMTMELSEFPEGNTNKAQPSPTGSDAQQTMTQDSNFTYLGGETSWSPSKNSSQTWRSDEITKTLKTNINSKSMKKFGNLPFDVLGWPMCMLLIACVLAVVAVTSVLVICLKIRKFNIIMCARKVNNVTSSL